MIVLKCPDCLKIQIIKIREANTKIKLLSYPITFASQQKVSSKKIPIKNLKLSIHFPDLDKIFKIFGKISSKKYGIEKPKAIEKNI